MKLNKVNDWMKIACVQMIAGILTIIFLEIYYVTTAPVDMYLMLLFSALIVVYYACAGVFLRNVNLYKIIILWGLMFIVAIFAPGYIGLLITGGVMMFATNFYHFVGDVLKHIPYSFPISVFGPVVITYVSMIVAKRREAKLQPYLEEIMKKNEEK